MHACLWVCDMIQSKRRESGHLCPQNLLFVNAYATSALHGNPTKWQNRRTWQTGQVTYFRKYLCPCGVLAIPHPGGRGSSSSSQLLCRWWWWLGGGGAAENVCWRLAGDECALIWLTGATSPKLCASGPPLGTPIWFSPGCWKNDAGKFLSRNGIDLFASWAWGSTTLKSASISEALFSRTWSTCELDRSCDIFAYSSLLHHWITNPQTLSTTFSIPPLTWSAVDNLELSQVSSVCTTAKLCIECVWTSCNR